VNSVVGVVDAGEPVATPWPTRARVWEIGQSVREVTQGGATEHSDHAESGDGDASVRVEPIQQQHEPGDRSGRDGEEGDADGHRRQCRSGKSVEHEDEDTEGEAEEESDSGGPLDIAFGAPGEDRRIVRGATEEPREGDENRDCARECVGEDPAYDNAGHVAAIISVCRAEERSTQVGVGFIRSPHDGGFGTADGSGTGPRPDRYLADG